MNNYMGKIVIHGKRMSAVAALSCCLLYHVDTFNILSKAQFHFQTSIRNGKKKMQTCVWLKVSHVVLKVKSSNLCG